MEGEWKREIKETRDGAERRVNKRRLIVDEGTGPHEIFSGEKNNTTVKDGAIEVMRLFVIDIVLDLTLKNGKGFPDLFVFEMCCDQLLLDVGTVREIL